jgi:molybdopterin converting factor small subunit
MGKVKVTYYGLIQHIVGNQENEYPISGNTTVRDLLHSLVQRYGDEFRAHILTSDWQLQPLAIIQLNDHNINEIDGLNTMLINNSKLSIAVIAYLIGGG